MTQAGYNMGALESCRSALESQAGPVGAIGDRFENQRADASIFGELASAGQLVSAVTELDQNAKREFDAAERLLRDAGRALDAVRTSMDEIDRANADAMR